MTSSTSTDEGSSSASTGEGPNGSPWALVDVPVVAGESITDVVATDDALFVGVSSYAGVRVLARVDDGPWQTRYEVVGGLPADLERGLHGEVWFSGGGRIVRITLDGAEEIASPDSSGRTPRTTWMSPQGILASGSLGASFNGFVMGDQGLEDEVPFTLLYAPASAAAIVDDRVVVGNQWGIARIEVGVNSSDEVTSPCGTVRDFEPDGPGVLAACDPGAIATYRDGRWSFFGVAATRIHEITAGDGIAWFAGDELGVRVQEQWLRLDEADAPAGPSSVSVRSDGTLWVVAAQRELWRREGTEPETAPWEPTTVDLTLDGQTVDVEAAWIGRQGDMVLYVAYGDRRILSVHYDAHGSGSVGQATITDGSNASVTHLYDATGSAVTDFDTHRSEGQASSAGSPSTPQLSLTWSGPIPRSD